MSKPRRRHTAEQKAELLRQHVQELSCEVGGGQETLRETLADTAGRLGPRAEKQNKHGQGFLGAEFWGVRPGVVCRGGTASGETDWQREQDPQQSATVRFVSAHDPSPFKCAAKRSASAAIVSVGV